MESLYVPGPPDRGHGYNNNDKSPFLTVTGQPTMDMHPKIAQFFEGKEQFYPVHLETKYNKIFSRIMDLWATLELEDFLGELMVDKRGGRQGFPPDVMNDILTLSRINGKVLELRNERREETEDPWASSLTRTSLAAEQIEFNMKGFARAIELDNAKAVKLFLKAGVRVDEEGPGGWTALMKAATFNRTTVATVLIGAKADVKQRDPQGYTPLHWAAFKGFPEMTKLLVEKGADVNAKTPLGLTPLMQATVWGHDRIVSYLLSKGARVNEADNDGLTALHAAVTDGHVAVVKVLVAAGADPNAKSAKGLTPAIIAQNKKNPAVLAELSK